MNGRLFDDRQTHTSRVVFSGSGFQVQQDPAPNHEPNSVMACEGGAVEPRLRNRSSRVVGDHDNWGQVRRSGTRMNPNFEISGRCC